ncbi:transposon Ty3-I Gag-Pol polyprotein [Trichonephila clavata]|uniref:Transposon Ty3-I Gag-Pol polyprotein n=1 Tax=Trichonephila clavata TaxID=2740835 RepID=A0A8X6H5P9_TRICU|nr:transposon Ty3-I Gag-Pol polyprotein [Trichonephila clavata]
MLNFYYRFLLNASQTQASLHELLKNSKKNDKRPVYHSLEDKQVATDNYLTTEAFEKCKADITTAIPGFHCTIQHRYRHVSGSKNVEADSLSRINEVHLPKIDFSTMAEAQVSDEELQAILGKNVLSLFLKPLSTDPSSSKLYCDVKENKIRPYVPEIFRNKVFLALRNISHPGVRATKRLIPEILLAVHAKGHF